jgi:Universal stress protein family
MTTENKAASNSKIQMRKILVPIDGSKCSLNAAKYAVKVAKDEMRSYFVFTLSQVYHMGMKVLYRDEKYVVWKRQQGHLFVCTISKGMDKSKRCLCSKVYFTNDAAP